MICVNENNLIPGKREYMNFFFCIIYFYYYKIIQICTV